MDWWGDIVKRCHNCLKEVEETDNFCKCCGENLRRKSVLIPVYSIEGLVKAYNSGTLQCAKISN